MDLAYSHVDVFSRVPFGGNSLPVFPDARGLSGEQMLRITQEMRHFEAIFLESTDQPDTVRARIFDLFDELPFAGHPIIGAAAVLHRRSGIATPCTWRFQLAAATVEITTESTAAGYSGVLDQGTPEFLGQVDDRDQVAAAFDLVPDDLAADLPMEVVSTGLRYLIVPVGPGALARGRISRDITEMLRGFGAQFAVLFDESAVEVRHWNNDGIIEDVATGSAAGVIGAYRLRHGLVSGGESFVLRQGQYTGRPSTLRVLAEGSTDYVETVKVGGDVSFVGHGVIEVLPGAR
ncbi:PhzF family phenazine biosynthesis protein [Mycolicibacterium smegmatis]|uniref:PhzF family phenazine biosynthesis protein n=1 Tax=Mycolicibacterium smegmatis TaxID=1772 RepID=UPI0005D9BBBF|nr:PhzF family phenazine biosynthesis protein [Mycolicibacterium smegmatis]MDF1897860.1 PhzF family phenazine biosynthesis protein [Mycolicibacterium smegmatis]MDF1904416.1 PhzF family phenazine biosynthesis protein [Mycolicibacterium smegmatis]MDF1917609.1 PhzF family phenazine biosynthesis protein [Mycolicibacterium smegmatis]MDF1922966.1 PhzF family phenazine biosynthesis protein [Mycolicibacterium smegmatis]UAK58099.1 PhzF family phenazine biosynthesis protein [Mycolicibacterium smegmatis]